MPDYDYICRDCGARQTVTKPMAEASLAEFCRECLLYGGIMSVRLAPMRRVYTPQGFIMRPSGYYLRPGDKGYSFFDRERELGELRDPGDADLHGKVEDDPADDRRWTMPEPDPRGMQEIAELGRTIDRQIREEMDLPSAILDLVER